MHFILETYISKYNKFWSIELKDTLIILYMSDKVLLSTM